MNVLVIGAGPADSFIGRKLAEEGHLIVSLSSGGFILSGASARVLKVCRKHDVEMVLLGHISGREAIAKQLASANIPFVKMSAYPTDRAAIRPLSIDELGENGLPVVRSSRVSNYSEGIAAALDIGGPPWAIWPDPPLEHPGAIVAGYNDAVRHAMLAIFETHEASGKRGTTAIIEAHSEAPELGIVLFVDGSAILPIGTYRDVHRVGAGEVGSGPQPEGAPFRYFAPLPEQEAGETLRRDILKIADQFMREREKALGAYTGLAHLWLQLSVSGPRIVNYGFGLPTSADLQPCATIESDLAGFMRHKNY